MKVKQYKSFSFTAQSSLEIQSMWNVVSNIGFSSGNLLTVFLETLSYAFIDNPLIEYFKASFVCVKHIKLYP